MKCNAVQASEKLYGVAEEAIRAAAYCLGLLEVREAKSEDRWSLRLLDKVALRLVDGPGRMVYG